MSHLKEQLQGSIALIDAENRTSLIPPPQTSPTPMSILQMAIAQGANIEMLERLMQLQERWQANEARNAFNAAFSAFKAESVKIIKNVTVSDGPLKGKQYADLFGVVDAITPLLSKHGLSHSWKLTKDEPTWIEVTCTVRHVLGHSELVSMGAAPDTGPGRNAIQARMSAISYLERYTLLGATGSAADGTDNDGNAMPPIALDRDEFDRVCGLLEEAATIQDLKTLYLAAANEAQKCGDKAALKKFADIKNKRYKELSHGS